MPTCYEMGAGLGGNGIDTTAKLLQTADGRSSMALAAASVLALSADIAVAWTGFFQRKAADSVP